jgi:hypothetical protein
MVAWGLDKTELRCFRCHSLKPGLFLVLGDMGQELLEEPLAPKLRETKYGSHSIRWIFKLVICRFKMNVFTLAREGVKVFETNVKLRNKYFICKTDNY